MHCKILQAIVSLVIAKPLVLQPGLQAPLVVSSQAKGGGGRPTRKLRNLHPIHILHNKATRSIQAPKTSGFRTLGALLS